KHTGQGGAAPPPIASPRRVASPPSEDQPPAAPKFGIGLTRGLAGRPIGKPSVLNSDPTPATSISRVPAALSAVERAELEELRLEKERLSRLTEDLRSERTKLSSEINELQNQNAQLIEDHTRDVLSIKA